jgi:hypothetical protein
MSYSGIIARYDFTRAASSPCCHTDNARGGRSARNVPSPFSDSEGFATPETSVNPKPLACRFEAGDLR